MINSVTKYLSSYASGIYRDIRFYNESNLDIPSKYHYKMILANVCIFIADMCGDNSFYESISDDK